MSTDITDFKKLQEDLFIAKEVAASAINDKVIAEQDSFIATTKALAEQEMRKVAMVLVGDIVHDLRTPITCIKVVADLLETMFPILFEIFEEAKLLGAKKITILTEDKWNANSISWQDSSGKLANLLPNTISPIFNGAGANEISPAVLQMQIQGDFPKVGHYEDTLTIMITPV